MGGEHKKGDLRMGLSSGKNHQGSSSRGLPFCLSFTMTTKPASFSWHRATTFPGALYLSAAMRLALKSMHTTSRPAPSNHLAILHSLCLSADWMQRPQRRTAKPLSVRDLDHGVTAWRGDD